MKFYTADWQSDLLLRSCSIAARGLWIELLCIMQKAEPAGHLLVNGKPPAPTLLSVLCGVSAKEISRLMEELQAAGVFDVVDGVIVSRRMVRDAQKAERDKANGRMGGNPRVKAGVNPPVNPEDKGEDKAHIPEARSQNTLGASAPSEPAPPDAFEEFWQAYPKRQGPNPKKPARQKFEKLCAAGEDPARIVAAVHRLARSHPRPTPYVPQAVTWLSQERFADDDAPGPAGGVSEERWKTRLKHGREKGQWFDDEWGPMPGAAGCRVPAHLLVPGDGTGWTAPREAA